MATPIERPTTFYDEAPVKTTWSSYDLTEWERVCGVTIWNDANPNTNPHDHLFISFDHNDGLALRLLPGESHTWNYGSGKGVDIINVKSNIGALPKRVHAWGQKF